jgi:Concanavalin A-like lectin/glucanases superfamily
MKIRFMNGLTALALAGSVVSLAATQAPSAGAATAATARAQSSGSGPGQNLSATASSSWQTNSTVWAIAPVNGMVYVGGNFTSVRPPGDPSGTGEVARTYLAEFNASTGALVTTFDPTLDGEVTALAVSPDGSTLYVGGSFTHVGTTYRDHLAAFSTSTGALSTTWAPPAGSPVLSIAVSPNGSDVYIGGDFTKLDNTARTYAGEVTSAAGALLPWAPDVNGVVTSIAVAPDDSRVMVGGYFSQFNGVAQQAVVDVDPTAGSTNILTSIEPNESGCTATVKDIVIGSVTAQNPAGVAYIASEGTGGGCFDGDWAADVSTGALVWQNDCLGATQSLVIINNWLYKGSHAHDCDFSPGGFPQVTTVDHHLLDQSLADGTLGHWNPDTDNGNSSSGAAGGGLGPRVMATDGTNMFLGGDFTTVNTLPQQGFAIFRPTPDTAPGRPAAPTVTSTSAGVDTVTFKGVSDPDDGTLTYSIYRNGVTAPVGTITATSWPWALPLLHFQDTGLTPGSAHTYTVTASDGTLTSAKSPASASVTVASTSPSLTYEQTVLNDHPSFLWQLNETSGSTAADASGNGFTGIYEPGTTQGVAGPFSGQTATAFDGQSGIVTSAESVASPGPQTFSVEAWFKTTTNDGGKIVGFGNAQTGGSSANNNASPGSSSYDRHIYMMNDGQLVFGVYDNGVETIETPDVYNDGQWHYVVATLGSSGMALYVDGQLIGTNSTTTAQAYTGYWRVGGDNLNGWNLDPWGSNSQGTTQPHSYFFNGTIADVAVYPTALTAAQVATHYAAALNQQLP